MVRSLQSFVIEIQLNKARIEDISPFHEGIKSVVTRRATDGFKNVTEFRNILEGFQPAVLLSSAWDTAVATGILAQMDYEVASVLSQTYGIQTRFSDLNTFGNNSLMRSGAMNPENLDIAVSNAVRYLNEVTQAEAELQAAFQVVLEHIQEYRVSEEMIVAAEVAE